MVHSCGLEPWWSGRTYFFAKEAGSKALEGSNPSGSAQNGTFKLFMEFIEFFTTIKVPVTVLHVLSVIFGMGAALMSDVLFTFYGKDKRLSSTEIKTLEILSRVVWVSLIAIVGTGLGLFLSDIPKYMHSDKFLAKMTIVVILAVNGFLLNKYVWKHVIKKGFLTNIHEGAIRKIAFACGAVSVLSWLFTCALGVLDSVPVAYVVIMIGYGVIIAIGILVALGVEYKTFEVKKQREV